MKLKALMAITGLTLFALIASAPSSARTKAEIGASADRALARFYALNPKHKELADKAAGILSRASLARASCASTVRPSITTASHLPRSASRSASRGTARLFCS